MAAARALPFHAETSLVIGAAPEQVFELLDEHERLSSHMTKSSWMMAGSSMTITTDEAHGKAIGSKISLSGTVLGISLQVDEVVTDRQPPWRKTWATIGSPRLLIIGPYAMGFSLSGQARGSLLRIFIDYELPESGLARLLGRLFARVYANWCTSRMAVDTAEHFRSPKAPLARPG